MRKEDLFSAIGGIDDRFIAEADEVKVKAPEFNLKRIGAIAACLVIAIAVVIGAANLGMNMGGESMMPEMPGIDKGDGSIEGENESIGGAELFERVENEAGYLVLEKLDGRTITLRIKLNDKEAFGIIYLEQYGEEKRYTAFNISAPAQEGYSESDAKIRLIYDPNKPYATNDNLGILCSINCENYWQVYIDPAETDPWLVEMYGDLSQQIKYYEDIGMPENFLHSMDRNEEEEEVFLEYGSELIEFMEAACAEFCTGIRDPYSDADWNAYLNEFEKLHVQESWLEVAQSCLDRKLGK